MKQPLVFVFIFIFLQFGSAQLIEDFSDGNFTENPTWQGDLNNFIVNPTNELQLNTSGSDTSVLFTAVEIPDSTIWEFEFNMDFAPSSNNRLRIYLQSTTTNYPDVDGYFLEIGESNATDALRLFRSDNGTRTEIATATEGALGSQPAMAKVKITRTSAGDWTIFANYDGGDVLNLEATAFDDTYFGGNLFFAFWCKNTSTNATNFSFDNIEISSLLPDITPPQITTVTPLSLTEIEVLFDEPLDSTSASDPGNFFIDNNIGNPQMATWNSSNQSKVLLTLNTSLTNQTSYLLEVQNVKDQADIPNIAASIPFDVDFESLELLDVVAVSSTELELEFNRSIDDITGSLPTNYTIDQGIGNPMTVNIDIAEPFRVYLELSQDLANGQTYNLQVENITDQIGLAIIPQSLPFDFLIGVDIEPGDLVINEILFNPTVGGSDFVEIYNNSNKFLDISDLIISNTTRTSGRDKDVEIAYILRPQEYAVLTSNREFILNNYTIQNPEVLFENSIPLFNDSDGNVSLFTDYGLDTVMIDSFDYNQDFHYPFLDDKEGTSLERISFDSPSQSRSNWHSAASLVGGATPTFKNSQFRPTNPADEIFTIAENVFSPNEDGFKDFLLIEYVLENPGYLATIQIFDAKGRLIKTLFENELLEIEGTIKWDGLTDEGSRARVGIYVILAEIFSPDKKAMQFKKTCVVASQLD